MPRGDRTGPAGQGPMTGRGMGFCTGFNVPGYMNPGFGRGFGRRFGWRWFQPNQFAQPIQPVQYSEADEKKILQEELKEIEAEMKEIQNRLKELK